MINVRERNKAIICAVIIILILCTVLLTAQGVLNVAYAADYSGVLEDLHIDSNFSESNFPYVPEDSSLQVIQVAESVDNELFVYVYQPGAKYIASTINISLAPRENISAVRNYKLRLLNSDGVFYKYIVDGLTVLTTNTRYYTIPSILRPYDEKIDSAAGNGNEISEVYYEVAKEYCFSTINGEPFCSVLEIETIEIIDKFVGFVRYANGFEFNSWRGACDSHFVAFSTDRDIDRLLEADVYYTSQSYEWDRRSSLLEAEITYGNKTDQYAYLKYDQVVEHTGDGWWAPTYTWNRIQTVDEFIAGENTSQDVYSGALINLSAGNKITSDGLNALKNKEWVLRFIETDYNTSNGTLGTMYQKSTIVGDVMILRLKFETDGVTYNLGVLDNKQSGDPHNPINEEDYDFELTTTFKLILMILGIVLLVVILAPVLPYIIQFLLWLIMLPFKAISALVKSAKKSKVKRRVKDNVTVPASGDIVVRIDQKTINHAKKKRESKKGSK